MVAQDEPMRSKPSGEVCKVGRSCHAAQRATTVTLIAAIPITSLLRENNPSGSVALARASVWE